MADRLTALLSLLIHQRTRGIVDSDTLLTIGEERMPGVMRHCERVRDYSLSIARELGLDAAAIEALDRAAIFHDIGKAAVPEPLLTKPSGLSPAECAIMRRHAEAGADILDATQATGDAVPLRDIAAAVRASHEWFGGDGYPAKLAGAEIPLASRILSVADAYDAMTEDRSYRKSLDSADAVAELLRAAPSQFDPEVVIVFLTVLGRQAAPVRPDAGPSPAADHAHDPPTSASIH